MKTKLTILAMTSALVLAGCAEDDDEHMHDHAMYQIKITNLTNHQPMTPPAAVLHNGSFTGWETGGAASTALEKLAEGGNTNDFLSAADMNTNVHASATLASAPFGPGESAMATLDAGEALMVKLTLASMLANTNDAFTGVDGLDLSNLMSGESISVLSMAFDAGTEDNTESVGTIPGPVDGGTGFDAARSTKDFVSIHPGVVTVDDGLSSSVLDESHRWMGPVAKIEVTRM